MIVFYIYDSAGNLVRETDDFDEVIVLLSEIPDSYYVDEIKELSND